MRFAKINLFVLFVACTLFALSACSGIGNNNYSQSEQDDFNAFIQEHITKSGLRGLSVAALHDNSFLLLDGFGTTSFGNLITENTPMYIGSLSKAFTATAVMLLVQDGKINLNAPIIQYLPDFSMNDQRYEQITVAQILNHASGMSDTTYPEMSSKQPTTFEEAAKFLENVKLTDNPGEKHHYHNPNYHLAARIVEVVSGQNFNDFLADNIFKPLEMTNTTSVLTTPNNLIENGGNYLFGQFISRPESERFIGGSHGIISTAADMSLWAKSCLNSFDNSSSKLDFAIYETIGHGFGWSNERGEAPAISYSGSTFTYSSFIKISPANNEFVVVLVNSRSFFDIGYEVTEGIIDLMDGREPKTGVPTPLYADIVLSVIAILMILYTILAVLRADKWAQKQRRLWVVILKMLPSVVAVVFFIVLPQIASLLGRNASWALFWHLWLGLVLFMIVVSICLVILWAVRIIKLFAITQ